MGNRAKNPLVLKSQILWEIKSLPLKKDISVC